jgi:predicted nucleotidyltransferase
VRNVSGEGSPTAMNPVRERAIQELRRIVLGALEGHDAAVYLYGSHARGEVRHASDIDVAILPRGELPRGFFADLAEIIEESTIPYDVDLVDMREVAPSFRNEVLRTGVKWRD